MTTAHQVHANPHTPKLYMAMELGKHKWDLGFATGIAQNLRRKTIDAASLVQLDCQIAVAKKRLGLGDDATVTSVYEAVPASGSPGSPGSSGGSRSTPCRQVRNLWRKECSN